MGGLKLLLISYLFLTYFVWLLLNYCQIGNKWGNSRKMSSEKSPTLSSPIGKAFQWSLAVSIRLWCTIPFRSNRQRQQRKYANLTIYWAKVDLMIEIPEIPAKPVWASSGGLVIITYSVYHYSRSQQKPVGQRLWKLHHQQYPARLRKAANQVNSTWNMTMCYSLLQYE